MAASRTVGAWQRTYSAMLTFVVVVLVCGCLYWARPVLIPTALAVLFTFLLSPVVTFLKRFKLPRAPAVVLVVSLAACLIAGIGWMIFSQMISLANQLPRYQQNVIAKISAIRAQSQGSLLNKLGEFVGTVTEAVTKPLETDTDEPPPKLPQLVEIVPAARDWSPFSYFAIFGPVLEPLATAGLVMVLVIYMLINREDMRNRLLSLFGDGRMTLTTKAIDEAAFRISRFLLAQFAVNVGFGVVVGLGLLLLQLPYAVLWGFLAAFLRYIPYIGPCVAALFPLSLSLLLSDGVWQPLSIACMFAFLELFTNLIVEPYFYGRSIGVSEAALIVAIAFWTWLWGAPGLMMATPLTVCLVVLGKYVPPLKMFDLLLGDESTLPADRQYFQRLLARDQDEASEIVATLAKESTLQDVCDRVLIPGLVYAKRELANDHLTQEDAEFIVQATKEIVEELAITAMSAVVESQPVTDSIPEPPDQKMAVLGCAAGDDADVAALTIFSHVLERKACDFSMVSTHRLISEIVAQVEEARPAIVCIVVLPPGGLAHTKLLCKRLRQRSSQLKIVVGRWGLANNEGAREQIVAAGADCFGSTLAETSTQLTNLAQLLRPAPPNLAAKAIAAEHDARDSEIAIALNAAQ